jgi:heme-degrading monooxygenase HmoA
MFIIVWEYQIKPEKQAEFESVYSSTGAWGKLFSASTGYMGTELLRDQALPFRYLTIDRWVSEDEYELFLSKYEERYMALDMECDGLTDNESLLGKWNSV